MKMTEQIEMTDLRKETTEQPTTLSKYAGLGAAITAELMTSFWFGIGVMLAIGIVDSLNYFVGALTSSGSK